jgi:cell fate (sporulation/competence/biofilm development) regulator YlbF (YheA/YmcA/DUF963 family)
MERSELMSLAYEASDELNQTEMVRAYESASKALDAEHLQPLIEAFNQAKSRFEDASKYGKHHPDFKQASAVLMIAKSALYQTPEYKAFQTAQATLNLYLGEVSRKLTQMLASTLVSSDKNICQKGSHHGQ